MAADSPGPARCGWPAWLVILMLATGCGEGGAVDPSTSGPPVTQPVASTTSLPTTTGSTTTTTVAPTTTPPDSGTTTTLPGEPFGIAPQPGAQMAVIGVRFDDVLNLRAAPGIDQPVLAGLAPTRADMLATGRSRVLREVIWFELEAGGTVGWASAAFLGFLGLADDLTSQVVADLGGIPTAETMLDLGLLVAQWAGVDEDGFSSRIALTMSPTVGDLGEVTYDVVGLQDDALRGLRLHVFGTPLEGGEGFSLKSVEATSLCGRGVTDDGLCT